MGGGMGGGGMGGGGGGSCGGGGPRFASGQDRAPLTTQDGRPRTDRRGLPLKGVDGNWECDKCGNVNFGSRDKCNRCANPKGGEMGGMMGGGGNVKEMALSAPRPCAWRQPARGTAGAG